MGSLELLDDSTAASGECVLSNRVRLSTSTTASARMGVDASCSPLATAPTRHSHSASVLTAPASRGECATIIRGLRHCAGPRRAVQRSQS